MGDPIEPVDVARDGDLQPDVIDEAVYVEMVLAEEDLGESRSVRGDIAARARDLDQQRLDAQLDCSLEETFPASDPVPISPGSD